MTKPFEVVVTEDQHSWYGWHQHIVVKHNGEEILNEPDYGEPEDKSFGRQFRWVREIIKKAYALGKVDGKKEVAQYVLDQGFDFNIVVGDASPAGSIDIRFPDSTTDNNNSGG